VKRKDTGNLGESIAQDFLKKKGCRILETNFRCHPGEIDIIALQGNTLVFVEVRCKTNSRFGSPEESITYTKMEHLKAAAIYYLQNHGKYLDSWRIDLIAIELDTNHKLKRINQIENAIEE
jgi:putative endonuclease